MIVSVLIFDLMKIVGVINYRREVGSSTDLCQKYRHIIADEITPSGGVEVAVLYHGTGYLLCNA